MCTRRLCVSCKTIFTGVDSRRAKSAKSLLHPSEITGSLPLSVIMRLIKTRGSSVFMAALDAKRAFDRVNHLKLFLRMCDIGVAAHVIKLIMTWYSNITMIVKWDGSYSNSCSVKCGVSPTTWSVVTIIV